MNWQDDALKHAIKIIAYTLPAIIAGGGRLKEAQLDATFDTKVTNIVVAPKEKFALEGEGEVALFMTVTPTKAGAFTVKPDDVELWITFELSDTGQIGNCAIDPESFAETLPDDPLMVAWAPRLRHIAKCLTDQ